MREERSGDTSVSILIPRILGFSLVLFFFSVLDPFSLIFVNISSLLLFFAINPVFRGIGLLGLLLFLFLIVRVGDLTPPGVAIMLSGITFGSLLRFAGFKKTFNTAIMTGFITLLAVAVTFAAVDLEGLSAWIEGLRSIMTEAMDMSYLRLQEAGLFELDEMVKIKEAMNGVVDLMVILIPAVAFINVMLAGALGLLLFGLLTRNHHLLPEMRALRYFSFSDAFIWGLIAGLLSLVIPLPSVMNLLFLNVLVIIVAFYLLRGLAVGIFWLQGKGFSTFLVGALYLFLFALLPPIFFLILFLPGLLDTWYDFRSLGEIASER
jgi:hypothetical protein